MEETKPQVIELKLKQLVTGDNYRRTPSKEGISDLAKSIKLNGVLQPLIITDFVGYAPNDDKVEQYLIVAGERRFLAAKRAKVKTVPCIYKPNLSEQEIAEIRLTENIQREDVDPLEEAAAFDEYLKSNLALGVDDLSMRLGKSSSFVRKRLELLKLTAEWEKVMKKEELPIGVALEIARCSVDHQNELLQVFIQSGRFRGQKRDVRRYIKENFDLRLSDALFPTDVKDYGDDGMPECKKCEYNTETEPSLFDDYKENICRNSACYNLRTQTYMAIKFAEYRAKIDEMDGDVVLFVKGSVVPDFNYSFLQGYEHQTFITESVASVVEDVDDDCNFAFVVGSYDDSFEIGETCYIKIQTGSGDYEKSTTQTVNTTETQEVNDKDAFLTSGTNMEGEVPPTVQKETEKTAERMKDFIELVEVSNKVPNIDWQILTITNLAFLMGDTAAFDTRIKNFCKDYISKCEETPSVWYEGVKEVYDVKPSDDTYSGLALQSWEDRENKYSDFIDSMSFPEKVSLITGICSGMSKKYLNEVEKQFNLSILYQHKECQPILEQIVSRLK